MKAIRWKSPWDWGDDSTRRWWIWIGLFVALWAAEWTWIQALTIPTRPITRHPFLIPTLRACFNGVGAVLLVMLIPRLWGLVCINILGGLCAVGLIVYSQYFKMPLADIGSVGLLAGDTRRVIPMAILNVAPFIFCVLLGVGAVKIALLKKAQPFVPGWPLRRRGIGIAVVTGLILGLALQATTYSFPRIALQPFSRSVYAYGYLVSWSHRALLYADTQKLLNHAKEEYDDYTDQAIVRMEDRKQILSPVIIVQVESLGFGILGHQVPAGEVVPFLNRLKEKSLVYRIRAFHVHNTADMDFACLAGGHPASDIINYQLEKLEYTNNLPLFLHRRGFQTAVYHGNTGDFFNRRRTFQKMKIDRLGFKEDLNALNLASSYWGIRDQALLMQIATEAAAATGRYFAFVITLDSHVPWDLIQPEEGLLFPGSRNITERYFNSIHWVDRTLEQWYEALPTGTTLLIYGDHTANLETDKFRSDRTIEAEYVPAILHRKGEDWSQTQRNRAWSLRTDELTLLDVMAYVRACIGPGETPIGLAEGKP